MNSFFLICIPIVFSYFLNYLPSRLELRVKQGCLPDSIVCKKYFLFLPIEYKVGKNSIELQNVEISLFYVLVRVTIAMKRHQGKSYKGRHLIGACLQFRGLTHCHHSR